jgi:hypothetical protein
LLIVVEVPRREKSLNPWKDCPACSWRNYPMANANPVTAVLSSQASWVFRQRCANCGEELEHEPRKAA